MPYLDVMLNNSAGATMIMRQQHIDEPVESILTVVDNARIRAVLLDAPEGWLQRRMMLKCELYCDGGVVGFTVMATPFGPQQIEFARPQDLTIVRHRQHVRVPTDLPVVLGNLGVPDNAPDPNRPGQHHRVVDISAGGARLSTPFPLRIEQSFTLRFHDEPLATLGHIPVKVVHVMRTGEDGMVGLAFDGLPRNVRSSLNETVAGLIRSYRKQRRHEVRKWLS